MKKVLYFFVLSALLVTVTSSLQARGMGERGERGFRGDCGGPGIWLGKPFRHLEMLQYQFKLTNAQVDKIYAIDKNYAEKFYNSRNDGKAIADLREKHRAELETLLTPEQKAKWDEFRKNRPERGPGRRDGRCPDFGPIDGMTGPGLGFMKNVLMLNDEQTDKIHRIRMSYMDSLYQNRNDAEKIMELRTKQEKEIEGVLTAEQKAKLEEFKKRPPRRDRRPDDSRGKGDRQWMYDDSEE